MEVAAEKGCFCVRKDFMKPQSMILPASPSASESHPFFASGAPFPAHSRYFGNEQVRGGEEICRKSKANGNCG